MCRFLAYHGPATSMENALLESSYSLVEQSKRARMRYEPINGDGFGVGWFPAHDDPVPGTFVSIEPAWSNRNLKELAAKITSRHYFAHIRDATPGMPVSQANCHPFKFGQWLWMHNGFLGEFSQYRRQLLASLSDESFQFIQGNTDTEHLFAMFLDAINHQSAPDRDAVIAALTSTINQLQTLQRESGSTAESHLNFAFSNGKIALYTRYALNEEEAPPTLYYQLSDDDNESLLVASEPLTTETNWQEVESHRVLLKEEGSPLEIMVFEP